MAAKNEMVRCIECKHGKYMQWFENPIICHCNILNEKFVAESKHLCVDFEKTNAKREVQHFDHY